MEANKHDEKGDHEGGDKGVNGKKDDKRLVVFNLDGKERQLEKGNYEVSWLKQKFEVPADYELDQVIDGNFEPLKDDQKVKIHGGEVFVSHVRGGGSS